MAQRIPILVVDDEPDFLELVEYNLKLAGFEVSLATSGQMAVEMAQKLRPTVILLDRNMPGMDGMEVLSELRHNALTERIPVIMLTAHSQLGEIEQAFETGADGHISKPVELGRLGAIVKAKLQKIGTASK